MRRIIITLLAAYCGVLLAGCGGPKIETPKDKLEASKEDPTKNTKMELEKKD